MTTTVMEVSNIVEAIRNVNRDVKDYYWMANHIANEEVTSYIQSTKHSVEATLPQAPYTTSDPTYRIVQRNIRIEKRKERILEKVIKLERAVETLDDERERIVIEGCMDNMSLKKIGLIIGVSRQSAFNIKEQAVRKLAIKMYL